MPALKKRFRTEFINRIDQVILFKTLTKLDATEIANRMVKGLVAHLKATKQIHLHVTDAAMAFLVEKGFNAELGVRHLRRVMDEELHAPLARQLVDGGTKRMRRAVVEVVNGKLALKQQLFIPAFQP